MIPPEPETNSRWLNDPNVYFKGIFSTFGHSERVSVLSNLFFKCRKDQGKCSTLTRKMFQHSLRKFDGEFCRIQCSWIQIQRLTRSRFSFRLRVIFLSELCMALSVVIFHTVLHKILRDHGENSASRVASHCDQLASRWSFSFFRSLIELLWMLVLLGIRRVIAKTLPTVFAACTTIQLQFSVGRYRGSFSFLGVCFGCILPKFTMFLALSRSESKRERCTESSRYRYNWDQNFTSRCFRDIR